MLLLRTASLLSLASLSFTSASPTPSNGIPASLDLLSDPLEAVLAHLDAGNVTSLALVNAYLARIEENNHKGLLFRAVIETAPVESVGGVTGVREIAMELDAERKAGKSRGRLHGVPVIVKDNCATEVSLGMNTTAGSYALRESISSCAEPRGRRPVGVVGRMLPGIRLLAPDCTQRRR